MIFPHKTDHNGNESDTKHSKYVDKKKHSRGHWTNVQIFWGWGKWYAKHLFIDFCQELSYYGL